MKKLGIMVIAVSMGSLVASSAMASTIDTSSLVINQVGHPTIQGSVQMPAAAWLFGTGLIGVVGVTRRRRE